MNPIQLHIRLHPTLFNWVAKKANSDNRTINNYIINLISKLKEQEKDEKNE